MMRRYWALTEVLVTRELKARYRGTALGFFWSFANPLLNVGIYVLVFSKAFRVPEPHYAAFVLCGLLPWNSFIASMVEGMSALVNNGNLLKKVYMPAEVFVFVAVLHNMVHFALSLPILLATVYLSGLPLTAALFFIPLLFTLQLFFALGLALILSSLAVQFRDLLHIVPNLVSMWFYLTPIIYNMALVPERFRPWYRLNPAAGLINGYRQVLLHGQAPSISFLGAFALVCACTLLSGLWLFRRRSDLYPELV